MPGDPLALIVTPYVPGVLEVNEQRTVAVPLPETMIGAGQFTPRPAVVVGVKVIVPAKLNDVVIVTPIETPV